MIRRTIGKLVWGAALVGMMSVNAAADVLLIEKVEEAMLRDLPKNGLSKSQVESRFGQPDSRSAPVGQPPITRWTYDDFNVYFEYDLVIESVLHHDAIMRELEARNGR